MGHIGLESSGKGVGKWWTVVNAAMNIRIP
jgi:hypothetical protein